MGTHYTPQSTDAQQWYIEYLHGQLDGSFLIISKINGKALYCKGGSEGLEVKAAERNDEDESQHWKRDGSYIVSKTLNKVFFSQPRTHLLHLTDKNVDAAFCASEHKDRVTFAIKTVSLSKLNSEYRGMEIIHVHMTILLHKYLGTCIAVGLQL